MYILKSENSNLVKLDIAAEMRTHESHTSLRRMKEFMHKLSMKNTNLEWYGNKEHEQCFHFSVVGLPMTLGYVKWDWGGDRICVDFAGSGGKKVSRRSKDIKRLVSTFMRDFDIDRSIIMGFNEVDGITKFNEAEYSRYKENERMVENIVGYTWSSAKPKAMLKELSLAVSRGYVPVDPEITTCIKTYTDATHNMEEYSKVAASGKYVAYQQPESPTIWVYILNCEGGQRNYKDGRYVNVHASTYTYDTLPEWLRDRLNGLSIMPQEQVVEGVGIKITDNLYAGWAEEVCEEN